MFLSRTQNSSLSAVAGHLGLSLPAMSRLINGLVDAGWWNGNWFRPTAARSP